MVVRESTAKFHFRGVQIDKTPAWDRNRPSEEAWRKILQSGRNFYLGAACGAQVRTLLSVSI